MVFVLAVLLLGPGSTTAGAQADVDSPAAADEEARLLFEAGARAFEDGRFEVALERFREAYELSHQPALLYNIGQSADRVRLDREALEAFEAYLAAVPGARNRREVEGRVAALRRILEAAPPHTEATADVASISTPAADAEGAREVAAPTEPSAESEAAADAGTEPALSDGGVSGEAAADAASVLGPLGWTSIALGVAGLGVAGAALGLRNAEAETFNGPECAVAGRTRGEVCGDHYDAATTWESVAVGTLIGGGVLVAAGAILLGVDAASGSEDTAHARLSCAPSLGPTWGLTCRGAF
jgi:hypothetical protein